MPIHPLEFEAMRARCERAGIRQPGDKPVAVGITKARGGRERDLHNLILAECSRRGWYVIHSRLDRPTTTAIGVPDFVIFAETGRVFCVECKTTTGKLTPAQRCAAAWLQKLGHRQFLIRSMPEFLEAVQR